MKHHTIAQEAIYHVVIIDRLHKEPLTFYLISYLTFYLKQLFINYYTAYSKLIDRPKVTKWSHTYKLLMIAKKGFCNKIVNKQLWDHFSQCNNNTLYFIQTIYLLARKNMLQV